LLKEQTISTSGHFYFYPELSDLSPLFSPERFISPALHQTRGIGESYPAHNDDSELVGRTMMDKDKHI
jgi:hypothetical protein